MTQDIQNYWTTRASGYSKVNQDELACSQSQRWLSAIEARIPTDKKANCKVLDIGTGPGFFSIILAEAGYDVTAVDMTEAMLEEAKANAGELRDKIQFCAMNAEKLEFEPNTFDVIVTRNVTWNLEHPDQAYAQWMKVLKPGGVMLNFDANWYCYLEDTEKRQDYEADRNRAAQCDVEDFYEGTDIEEMERIAGELPLTFAQRPNWDAQVLENMGVQSVTIDPTIWQEVWSKAEKINYTTTPMFLVQAVK